MSEIGVSRPTDAPISSSTKMSLRRRVEAIRPSFLIEAGFTEEDFRKVLTSLPITWDEYNVLLFKVARAEALQQEAWAIRRWEEQSRLQKEQSAQQTKIPTWLWLMIGVVIFLLINIIVLRRT